MRAAWGLCRERYTWHAWGLLLERTHAVLRYTAAPVQEIFRTIDRSELSQLEWLLEHDGDEPLSLPASLGSAERTFAEGFLASLGTTDLEGQLAHIVHYRERAAAAERAAHEAYTRRGKAYVMTGVSVGLCLGLALL